MVRRISRNQEKRAGAIEYERYRAERLQQRQSEAGRLETGERFQLQYHEARCHWAIQPQTTGTSIPDLSEPATRPQPRATGPADLNNHNEDREVLDLA